MALRNSTGTALSQNDNATSSTKDAALTYTVSQSGTYYLEVGAGTGSLGSYLVSTHVDAVDDYLATMATTGTLSVGASITGEIEVSRDRDWFKITLERGVRYQFVASATENSDPLVDPSLSLRDAASRQLINNDNANSNTTNALINYTPTATGTYYLEVAGRSSGTGTAGEYSLTATTNASLVALTGVVTLDEYFIA